MNAGSTRYSAAAELLDAQVRRLQRTARYLVLQPVFTDDGRNLGAELFDNRGQLVEVWAWPR